MPIDYGNHSVNTSGEISGSGLVVSDTSLVPNSSGINNIVSITQSDYDAIGSGNYSDTTLYVITD